jgi:hypothetical protein
MNASPCKYEQEVMTALRWGPFSYELQAHVAGCGECSEVISFAHCLQRDADSMNKIPIPDPDLVWRRALLRSRGEAAARAVRPIQWVVHASIAVLIAAVLWLMLGLPEWLGSLPEPVYTSSLHTAGMWVAVSFVAGAATILTALLAAVYILRLDRVPIALVGSNRTWKA